MVHSKARTRIDITKHQPLDTWNYLVNAQMLTFY